MKFFSNRSSILVSLLLACGIFFRFYHLDKKFYWEDEAWTSLRISGYMTSEVRVHLARLNEVKVEDLQKFQHVNRDRGVLHVLIAIAADPEHPPLYFLTLRGWANIFGDSILAIRCFSATISLLAFPCLYWLSLELFRQHAMALTAISFTAVSPLHVLFAQEARPYGMFIVMILLSSAALLRAIRVKSQQAWLIYAVTIVLSIYTHILFILILVSHGLYILGNRLEEARFLSLTDDLRSFLKASLLAMGTFIPWILPIIVALPILKEGTEWLNQPIAMTSLANEFLSGLSSVFIDTYSFRSLNPASAVFPLSGFSLIALVHLSILIVICYSLYFLYHNSSKEVWLYVYTLAGVTLLAMLLPDLISGGQRSTVARYMFPFYLGVQLSVAFLFSSKIFSGNAWQRSIFRAGMVILMIGGISVCSISSQSEYWWNKGDRDMLQIARIINNSERPLVVSDMSGFNIGLLLSLSHALKSNLALQLEPDPAAMQHIAKIPERIRKFLNLSLPSTTGLNNLEALDRYGEIFLLDRGQILQKRITSEERFFIEPCIPNKLWKIRHRSAAISKPPSAGESQCASLPI